MSEEDVSRYNVPQVRGTWVQAERSAMDMMGDLNHTNPRAATLMLKMIAHMDERGALVASQTTLARLAKCSLATVKRAIVDLVKGNWIQTVTIGGGRGSTLAYVVNSRVAWADKRDNLKYASFQARVLVSEEDNPDLGEGPLNRIPVLGPDDQLSIHGPGLPAPRQEQMEETMGGFPTIRAESTEELPDGGQQKLI